MATPAPFRIIEAAAAADSAKRGILPSVSSARHDEKTEKSCLFGCVACDARFSGVRREPRRDKNQNQRDNNQNQRDKNQRPERQEPETRTRD
ncbi:hypothetical protein EYF80_000298 [Liparis tanakae]|uniref:Uncharacterized protein n=1 Tax=Liparis tanakae TaxID=230148 RepID=A0A4Z2JHD3_9TELE|nr:hypothetical protein EYF80_000298 [Liparis tanakae]